MVNDKYIGRLLDNRYEILEVIGVGGMAVVYKARCHRLNRLVAVKILKDDYCQDEEFRRRFHAEGQAVAMVSHPNIVSVYDVSTSNDADYIVMELIDGISLKQYMEKKGVLNWKETLHFAIQIGKAMEHAHGRGIVHRDIKPHNVMVLKNGSVKVADFGIARVMSQSNTLTREALGSVHYISPEQAKGGRVDNRSDIYSLGVVMYEMMTGRPPYNGESPVAVAIQHINGGAAMPSTINPNIPGGLEQIIMKAMAHDISARYDTATAMLYDMDEFRKNPSILFDYNTPPTDAVLALTKDPAPEKVVPVVTPVAPAGASAAQSGPSRSQMPPADPRNRSTAQRVVSEKTDQPRRQPGDPHSRPNARTSEAAAAAARRLAQGAPNPPARRTPDRNAGPSRRPSGNAPVRRREEVEEDDNRFATIAIFACSAVAVVALIVFLVVLLSGGCSAGVRDSVIIPNVEGMDYNTAYEKYENNKSYQLAEVDDEDWKYDPNVPYGHIISQSPEAGDEVAKGTVIRVVVSKGKEVEPFPMPDLIGLTRDQATSYLDGAKLNWKIEYREVENEDEETDKVVETKPTKDEQVRPGDTVTLVISAEKEVITSKMPDVTNKRSFEEAEKWLNDQNRGWKVEKKEEENLEVEEGTILRTEPAADEDIKDGDTIYIYVATGMKTEPMIPVTGMTYEEAEKALATLKKDLDLKLEMVEGFDENTEEGKVYKTEPAFGQDVKSGDTVKIYVCTTKKAKVPYVVGMHIEGAKVKLEEFTNIKVEYRTSDKDKDTVISQSIEKDSEVALDTEIILVVSKGLGKKTAEYKLDMGSGNVDNPGGELTIEIVIKDPDGNIVYSGTVSESKSVKFEVTGYGKVVYRVYLAEDLEMGLDVAFATVDVDFDA